MRGYGILASYAWLFAGIMRISEPLLAILSATVLYYMGLLQPFSLAKVLAIYGGVLLVLVFPIFGLYRSWRGESLLLEMRNIIGAWIIIALLFNGLILLLADPVQFEILWPLGAFRLKGFWLWVILSCLTICILRGSIRIFLRYLRKKGWNQRNAVIVGAGEMGVNLAVNLKNSSWIGVNIMGFYDDYKEKGSQIRIAEEYSLPVLGNIQECINNVIKEHPHMVIIALPMRLEEKISEVVWALGLSGISVFLVPDLFAFGLQKARLRQWGDVPIMAFNLFPGWKRIFDMFFASFIIVLTSPIFLIIMGLIKQEDGGPIFYRHKRIGECGQPFGCLKFRTMHVDADKRLKEILAGNPEIRQEWERTYKLKDDPRVTRIGRFLRKTSLDELPQFINVLMGEMSVVGARPVVSDELTRYYKDTALTYCAMKPGITGPWQAGKRSDVEDYDERVGLDRWYILNSSIWLDFQIILKTVFKMFTGKGAY